MLLQRRWWLCLASSVFAAACSSFGSDGGVHDASTGEAGVADEAGSPSENVSADAAADGPVSPSDASADAGSLRAFVTSVGYQVSTAANADTLCAAEAIGRLPGKFVAWFSTPTVPAADRLVDSKGAAVDGPWYRVDGKRVVASRAALLATTTTPLENPIAVTAVGASSSASVWTRTLADGGIGKACPDSPATAGIASKTDPQWTEQTVFTATCPASLALYCFQVE